MTGKDEKEPVTPVPAATIMLLREREEELQVFMVVRHHQIDFASGALVFPGGKVDDQDFGEDLLPFLTGADADTNTRAIQVSAIREAFEECGILLAYDLSEPKQSLVSGARLGNLDAYRRQLNDGSLSLLDFLKNENLSLACDQLVRFAHWITPPMMPKRFDTHFYLAVAPDDHLAVHDGYESVDSVWISPDQAVADAQEGRRTVIFPTRLNIQKLGQSQTISQALARAHNDTIVAVLPWTEKRQDGDYVCIPVEAGYAVSEEKIPSRQT